MLIKTNRLLSLPKNTTRILLTVFLLVKISHAISSNTPVDTLSQNIPTELKIDNKFQLIIEAENYTTTTTTSTEPPLADVSKTTMDIITIIWYLSTFLALAAFFFLMACSDRRCSNRQSSSNTSTNNNNQGDGGITSDQCPPTPSPSYSEFAPPTYESIIKQNLKHSIYVVPVTVVDLKLPEKMLDSNNINNEQPCKVHTINETQRNK